MYREESRPENWTLWHPHRDCQRSGQQALWFDTLNSYLRSSWWTRRSFEKPRLLSLLIRMLSKAFWVGLKAQQWNKTIRTSQDSSRQGILTLERGIKQSQVLIRRAKTTTGRWRWMGRAGQLGTYRTWVWGWCRQVNKIRHRVIETVQGASAGLSSDHRVKKAEIGESMLGRQGTQHPEKLAGQG